MKTEKDNNKDNNNKDNNYKDNRNTNTDKKYFKVTYINYNKVNVELGIRAKDIKSARLLAEDFELKKVMNELKIVEINEAEFYSYKNQSYSSENVFF